MVMYITSQYFVFNQQPHFIKVFLMKIALTAVISAFMLFSAPAFAGAHGGGKMDDKKVDCSKKENAKNAACVKK